MRIAYVTAQSVGAPRRRNELHRSLGARVAVVAEPVEAALHEVDRREDLPAHAEPTLRFAVPAQQPSRRLGLPDADARLGLRRLLRCEREQRTSGAEVVACLWPQA